MLNLKTRKDKTYRTCLDEIIYLESSPSICYRSVYSEGGEVVSGYVIRSTRKVLKLKAEVADREMLDPRFIH